MKTFTYTFLGLSVLIPALAYACPFDWGFTEYGMMGYGGGLGFFMVAGGIVWVLVGILACVWLWQNINKK